MRKSKMLLLFLLVVFTNSPLYSQNIVREDVNPRYLVLSDSNHRIYYNKVDDYDLPHETLELLTLSSLNSIDWINTDDLFSMYKVDIPWDLLNFANTSSSSLWEPRILYTPTLFTRIPCGDSYYENGQIRNRCECNDKGQYHGKIVTWNTQGEMSEISYYYKELLTSRFSYKKGKVTREEHYRVKNGKSLKHGKQISYNGSYLITSHYADGKQNGVTTHTKDDRLYSEFYFENDELMKKYEFNDAGDTILTEFYQWNKGGDDVIETGTWRKFSKYYQTWTYSTYDKGIKREVKKTKNGKLTELHDRSEDDIVCHLYFDSSGMITSQFYVAPNWDYLDQTTANVNQCQDDLLSFSYYLDQSKFHPSKPYRKFVNSGFITIGTRKITYENIDSTENRFLLCYELEGKDTLRQLIVLNNGVDLSNVINRNEFRNYENAKSQRQGKWLFFEENKIVAQKTYNNGVLHGQFIRYDTSQSEPRPILIGNYSEGDKDGNWKEYQDSLLIETYYHSDSLQHRRYYNYLADTAFTKRDQIMVFPQGTRKITATEKLVFQQNFTGNRISEVLIYNQQNDRRWEGEIKNSKAHGVWKEIRENGLLIQEGMVEDGIPVGKWKSYYLNKKGELKSKRMKIYPQLPEIPFL